MNKISIAAAVTGLLMGFVFFGSAASADQGQALIEAAAKGDMKQVQDLLDKGADVNAKGVFTEVLESGTWFRRDTSGRTALSVACEEGHFDVVKLLLDKGADVNATNKFGRTALMYAAVRADSDVLKLLLDKGSEINTKDKHGETALLCAVSGGKPDVVKMLLGKGADVADRDKYGKTALSRAVNGGRAEVIKEILNMGAEVNARDKAGKTALMEAAGGSNSDVVKMLLDKGADVAAREKSGKTVLMIALEPRLTVKSQSRSLPAVNPPITYGSPASLTTNRSKEVLSLLLDKGADVNAKDEHGRTALMCASDPLIEVEGDSAEDAPTQIEFKDGGTVLELKIKNGTVRIKRELPKEIIELLRAHGAKE